MTVAPGAVELTQETSTRPGQLSFFSKLPFVSFSEIVYHLYFIFIYYHNLFCGSNEPKKSKVRRLKLYEIYKFANIWNILFMIMDTIAGSF
jgi:hypothetical protein